MRRAVLAAATVALVLASCGEDTLSSDVSGALQSRVASIRKAAEAGAPAVASDRIDALVTLVDRLLSRGELSDDRALAIVAAAERVRTQLSLLPARSAGPSSPSPLPPEEEDEETGGGNDGGKDKDEGNGKGNGKGKGNDGDGGD